MKVAVDKNTWKVAKNDGNEYIYIYEDESLQDLMKTKLVCKEPFEVKEVDINTTNYMISCKKKCKITDKDWNILPEHKNYKYAIIVPNCNNDHGNYNGKTFLQNCIESILNQKYANFELIIVDDCSYDTSVKTIEEYKDERITLIKNKRKRYNGGSRNVGIEYALDNFDFDYFCFLDSDDWWKDNNVLKTINDNMYDHEMMLLGLELIDKKGVYMTKFHEYNDYKDFFLSDNKVWCTAWARVIRKDKIVYFCEDTLMEDRVWSYRQADNIDLDKVYNLKEVCYVWNRTNVNNSVSQVRSDYWNASAWVHIGHQLQLISQLKHKEMRPILLERIEECKKRLGRGQYEQY